MTAFGATYDVGIGKPYTSIGAVPWATLNPGDTVRIHWRSTPYKEKWVIGRQGTAAAPIRVIGVLGMGGVRPVIDGAGAVTSSALNYWNEDRGVIKFGGSNKPANVMPRHIVIENLDVRNAHTPYTFKGFDGATRAYLKNAAAVYIEKGENITLRNNILRGSGNGIFIASSDALVARDVVIEGNYIHGNGNVNSSAEHNVYTSAAVITFQNNRFGPVLPGSAGNNIKDRSAGVVIRYNWIEGGNRQLDLVDASGSVSIRTDPRYGETYVYGNFLLETTNDGNRQIVHYGGDGSNKSFYRRGVLYFYNNTIVSYRTDRITMLSLSTNSERSDARNNIFYSTGPGNAVSMSDTNGHLALYNNWAKPGWVKSFSGIAGSVTVLGATVEGTSPAFVNEAAQDFRLATTSPVIDRGAPLHPLTFAEHDLTSQYLKHQKAIARPRDGVLDIGAFEK